MIEREEHRREWIEERAGILEFDAGMAREQAETLASAQWVLYVQTTRSREHGTSRQDSAAAG
jgi:hypothetical protein